MQGKVQDLQDLLLGNKDFGSQDGKMGLGNLSEDGAITLQIKQRESTKLETLRYLFYHTEFQNFPFEMKWAQRKKILYPNGELH